MVGAIIGAGVQVGSSIYGAIKSSQANKKAQQLITSERDANQKWYEQKMAEDYTRRADAQNLLRKQRELFQEQYQKARATNLVAGGTDESLALQQAGANETMGETMGDIAAQASAYKEGVEEQYREKDAALNQQEVAIEQNKAQQIANAAGQMGSAVSGLMTAGMEKPAAAEPDFSLGERNAIKPEPSFTLEGIDQKSFEQQTKGGVPELPDPTRVTKKPV